MLLKRKLGYHGQPHRKRVLTIDTRLAPSPVIMAGGIGGASWPHYWLVPGGVGMEEDVMADDGKPLYVLPTMADLAGIPQTGYKLVSTFTGAGGSCLGFRWAGFQTLWASEFVPEAASVYMANYPSVPVDMRDIRTVTPEEVLERAGVAAGELDVLEGSPPCASFSTAGKRDRAWGEVRSYSSTHQVVDDLFWEFARILRGVQPRAFVAENVRGLVMGKARGYFKQILAEMQSCGYAVTARLLDAQWLGVPQSRARIFFVGVREDLVTGDIRPVHPRPLKFRYTVADALPWIKGVRRASARGDKWTPADEGSSPTILQSDGGRKLQGTMSSAGIVEAPVGSDDPQMLERLVAARVVHDTSGQYSQGDVTHRPCPSITVGVGGLNSVHFQVEEQEVEPEAWLDGYVTGEEWSHLAPGESSDRFFNLIREHPDRPAHCVSAVGGNAGTAAVTHPVERRKFTIAELRRICGFPADFKLLGTYREQWERLGRAVPPPMAFHVARAIRDEVLIPLDGGGAWAGDPPCLVAGVGWEPPGDVGG